MLKRVDIEESVEGFVEGYPSALTDSPTCRWNAPL
jgi:hypothetical protein